jgi:hypothetical protein
MPKLTVIKGILLEGIDVPHTILRQEKFVVTRGMQ